MARIFAAFDDGEYRFGKVACICWCAHLVEDHSQLWFFCSEAKHCEQEVFAVFAVEPRGAENQVMAYCGGVLSGQLGAAIGAGGVGLQLFAAGGVMRGSAKDIVGGEVYQRTADGLHGLGHISYGVAVDAQRCSFVALCFVYIGVGGAVHYQAYIVLCYKGGHIFTRGDVQLLDVGEQPVVRRCRCQQAHVSAQLSVGSCDQYVHGFRME